MLTLVEDLRKASGVMRNVTVQSKLISALRNSADKEQMIPFTAMQYGFMANENAHHYLKAKQPL